MLRQSVVVSICVGFVAISCGCAMDGSNALGDAFHQTARAVTPRSSDKDATKDGEDDWDEVGRQARADRPIQQENDPLRNLFVSPRAQEIERSLGVD